MNPKRPATPRARKPIEALHLVALSIDARQKEGTPGHAAAVRLHDEAVTMWKEQSNGKRCPHCGGRLRG
jgi:hypothetical protein